ncbi:threonine ammonia-lyase [Opitutaceae bacterium]
MNAPLITLDSVRQAHARIAGGLRPTPCAVSGPLSELAGMSIIAKHDYLQSTGSFKERGARHALECLDAETRARGVVAASAGNHALGLAHHGRELGIRVTVVMPRNAPRVKASRCHALGAHVVLHGENFEEAEQHARSLADTHGFAFVHPFNDASVIAGQGTLALEILFAHPELDAIVLPVGGGGLLAGVATVVKALRPEVQVIAVEPAHAAGFGAALSVGRSVRVPLLPTLADGLAVAQAGSLTLSTARPGVDRCVTVSEDEIAYAMLVLAEHHTVSIEGAGAAGLAACLAGRLPELAGKRVAVPLTGRNVDPSTHARALRRGRAWQEELRDAALAR